MHRVAQFVSHVRARVAPDEAAFARRVLPASAWALFDDMAVADRRHGLDVAQALLDAGHDSADVLAAALLHDAAKGRRMRLWHRVTGVLLERVAPAVLRRLSAEDPRSWRHPFWLYLHHGPMSADLAEAAGCTALTVRLMRAAPRTGDEARLVEALRDADDAS